MMRSLGMIAGAICRLNWCDRAEFSWLALGIVLVCFTVVVQRYVFRISFVWMQDLYIWLNGAMFTAVAGFALLRDDHVRVDIFYRPARMRHNARSSIWSASLLFLLPFMLRSSTSIRMPFVHARPGAMPKARPMSAACRGSSCPQELHHRLCGAAGAAGRRDDAAARSWCSAGGDDCVPALMRYPRSRRRRAAIEGRY